MNILHYNENIKIANKVIDEKYINNDKMLNLKIIDILDVKLNFKTIVELNTEMNITISQMKYNSITGCFHWSFSAWETHDFPRFDLVKFS